MWCTRHGKEEKLDFIIAKLGGIESSMSDYERMLSAHEVKLNAQSNAQPSRDDDNLDSLKENMATLNDNFDVIMKLKDDVQELKEDNETHHKAIKALEDRDINLEADSGKNRVVLYSVRESRSSEEENTNVRGYLEHTLKI